MPRQKLTYRNLQPRQYDPTGTYGDHTINHNDSYISRYTQVSSLIRKIRNLNASGSLEPQDINTGNHFKTSPSFLSLWETKLANLVVVIFIAIRRLLVYFLFIPVENWSRFPIVLISKNFKASKECIIHWQHQVKDR